jgi:hypothetical protein
MLKLDLTPLKLIAFTTFYKSIERLGVHQRLIERLVASINACQQIHMT